MPTNLPAEAKAKWIKVMDAKTPEEKIRALEEFLSAVPKHKGTEKLREWATKRLAQLRDEVEEKRRKRGGGRNVYFVEKEGDVQVVVVGPPNTGKSLLVYKLTGAKTIIAHYPFSTIYPVPGSLKYNDVYFQLVDTPPLSPNSTILSKVIGLIRNADGVLLVLDSSSNYIDELSEIVKVLREEGVLLSKPRGRIILDTYRTGKTGIRVTLLGKLIDSTVDDIRKLLESYRIYNAHVKIYGEATLDDVEQAIFESTTYKPTVVFINKTDLRSIRPEEISELKKILSNTPIITGSVLNNINLDKIPAELYRALEIIRIYTKSPNTPPASKPVVLKKNATVRDVARAIHSDFIENFLYAKIWGSSVKYPGEKVGLDHVLHDGDIVEIHTKG